MTGRYSSTRELTPDEVIALARKHGSVARRSMTFYAVLALIQVPLNLADMLRGLMPYHVATLPISIMLTYMVHREWRTWRVFRKAALGVAKLKDSGWFDEGSGRS